MKMLPKKKHFKAIVRLVYIPGLFVVDHGVKPVVKVIKTPKEIQYKKADIVTFIGFACSLAAMFLIFQQKFNYAYILILCQVALDFFDGRLARKSNNSNEFGLHLDSFSDFFTIVVTGLMGYFMGISNDLVYFIIPWFIFAAMLRLSIFAIIKTGDDGYFRGFPTTSTSLLISTLLILNHYYFEFSTNYFLFIFGFFALLMPSSIRIKKI